MKLRNYALITSCFLACRLYANETVDNREPLYHESLRPQFHFTARYWDEYQLNPPNHHEGWINDVNGLVYNEGVYHFFAQRWWSAWLHAVSTDLIHWKELPPAFGKGGRFGGTQSGGCVVDRTNSSGLGDGRIPPMIAFWSSTDNESQCISYSLDRGQTWTKYTNNPVLSHKYRDPNVFWYEPDKKWILILYGPSGEPRKVSTYGFNGESNDAHDLMEFSTKRWICSAIRLNDDATATVTDQHSQRKAAIDIAKQNVGAETFCVGAKSNLSEFFQGDIAEILVYNRSLSDEETKSILSGLQSKWGLIQPQQDFSIPAEGFVLHLDAAVATTDPQGNVSRWEDLSGRNNHMTPSADNSMPKRIDRALGRRPVIRFEGMQFLQGPAALEEGDDSFSIVALWRRNTDDGSQVLCEQNAKTLQAGRRASFLTVCHEEAENVYLLFSSTNLLEWKQLDTFIPNSFECPDMFPLLVDGDAAQQKWVVVDGNGDYTVGRFDGHKFAVESPKAKGDYGRNFYATMTFDNMPSSDPRRIQLAWMRGWDEYPKNMPFNQQISFPCELSLRQFPEGIVLCRYPVREVSQLYDRTFSLKEYTLSPNQNPLSNGAGALLDVNLVVDITKSTCTQIAFNLHGNTVSYDVTNNLLDSVDSKVPLKPRNGQIEIRILIDRLSIETFGNRGEVSITNVAYPKDNNPPLSLNAVGGEAKVLSLEVHTLKSIWE